MDSDVYKALEAAAYSLATHPDPALDKRLDEIIAMLAAAQQPDGYLNTLFHGQGAGQALDQPARLARALLRRPHVRGGRRPLPGHRQEELPRRRHQARRPHRLRVRPAAQAPGLSRPSGDRAGADQALARHRRAALLQPGPVLRREPRPEVLRRRTPHAARPLRRHLLAGRRAHLRSPEHQRPRRARRLSDDRRHRRRRRRPATPAC